jgi:hypothetical protein
MRRKLLPQNKKGQVGQYVFGIGALVVLIVVMIVIIATIKDADMFPQPKATSNTVTNESGVFSVFLNRTTYTLAEYNGARDTFTITSVYNLSAGADGNQSLTAANYTLSSTGVIQNASTTEYDWVSISYTYNTYSGIEDEIAFGNLSENFSAGINEVALQIPTILKLAAIVLLIGIIVFLVIRVRPAMNFGSGEGGSL